MISNKLLEIALVACSFLLATCVTIPAGAGSLPEKPSVYDLPKDVPGADGISSVSGTAIPHSYSYSKSTSPPIPDASNEKDLLHEHTITPRKSCHLDGDIRLRFNRSDVVQRGIASWYGPGIRGRKSADGERFDMNSMTAAHPNLPLHSWVLVRNIRNNKMALLKVTDRGPYSNKRILDVSYAAAKQLGFVRSGTTQVEVRQLSHSEVSWVRRQLDAGIDVSAGDGFHGAVDAGDASADKAQQKIHYDDK
ncbi:septal ring lytic transglycosylase RlpA family protein [Glaciimonas soli]|uniref:Endolytic peptidoglycan transglycosylase RlpA n=1 Tax=Glaciimonas soli TaxID=2590999 RepID=A0A843YUR1_9BURK|nr:septal ring lytic transglycosylase RlpA family protein [Glaciimonas soli]MQR01238.1 septal ring lytic transglycosylase RlpA family protein [Glaciimonas soli]